MNHPAAYIPRDRLQSILNGTPLPKSSTGTVLFADVAGYTNLVETLVMENKTYEGVQVATEQIRHLFDLLIKEAHRRGGVVMAFAGDAITVSFENDDGLTAVAAALAMQAEVARDEGDLQIKIAVASGEIRRMVLGDPAIQQLDVVTGKAMEKLNEVLAYAENGRTVLQRSLAEKLANQITVDDQWSTPLPQPKDPQHESHAYVTGLVEEVAVDSTPVVEIELDQLPTEPFKAWLLDPLYDKLVSGDTATELRVILVLFIKFEIKSKYKKAPDVEQKLRTYVNDVQRVLHKQMGYLYKVNFDDKGNTIMGVFGAPYDYERVVNRGLAAALELKSQAKEDDFIDKIYMGLAQGWMLAGPFGNQNRAAYDLLGSEATLANRLMSSGLVDQIVVSPHVRQQAAARFTFQQHHSLELKGFTKRMRPHLLQGEVAYAKPKFETELIGRDREMAKLEALRAEAIAGRGRVVLVDGEAGMGKSHFVSAFTDQPTTVDLLTLWGGCSAGHNEEPYYVWRQMVQMLADEVSTGDGVNAELTESIMQTLDEMNAIPAIDSTTSDQFARVIGSMVELFAQLTALRPLVLIVDDIQWIDEPSDELLKAVARYANAQQLFIVLVNRSEMWIETQSGEDTESNVDALVRVLGNFDAVEKILLLPLQHDDVVKLLRQQFMGEPPSGLLADLSTIKSDGNPLRIIWRIDMWMEAHKIQFPPQKKEWVLSSALREELVDNEILKTNEDGQLVVTPYDPLSDREAVNPFSIVNIMQTRIDQVKQDVAPSAEITLRLASVMGRTFDVELLTLAHPDLTQKRAVEGHLLQLADKGIVKADNRHRQTFSFVHPLIQETQYGALNTGIRKEYHGRIGAALETFEYAPVEQLAYHYNSSDNLEKQIQYVDAAAKKSQRAAANRAALRYYEQALDIEDLPADKQSKRAKWLYGKVEMLINLGKRRKQADALEELGLEFDFPQSKIMYLRSRHALSVHNYGTAKALCQRLLSAETIKSNPIEYARLTVLRGNADWRLGKPQEIPEYTEEALSRLEPVGKLEFEGIQIYVDLLNNLGEAYRETGGLELAATHAERASELAIAHQYRAGEARALDVKASLAFYANQFAEAEGLIQKKIKLDRSMGDLIGEAFGLVNFGTIAYQGGFYDLAEEYLSNALTLFGVVTEEMIEARARNMMGLVQYELGNFDASLAEFERGLGLAEEIKASGILAELNGNCGLLLREMGKTQAAAQRFDHIRVYAIEENYKDGEALSLLYLAQLHLQENDYTEAIQLAKQSLEKWREIGAIPMTTANLTTLALAYHYRDKQDDSVSKPLDLVEEALPLLDEHAAQYVEYPHRDYFACWKVLSKNGEVQRADDALCNARAWIWKRAAKIKDKKTRQALIKNGPGNREILAAYKQMRARQRREKQTKGLRLNK